MSKVIVQEGRKKYSVPVFEITSSDSQKIEIVSKEQLIDCLYDERESRPRKEDFQGLNVAITLLLPEHQG